MIDRMQLCEGERNIYYICTSFHCVILSRNSLWTPCRPFFFTPVGIIFSKTLETFIIFSVPLFDQLVGRGDLVEGFF